MATIQATRMRRMTAVTIALAMMISAGACSEDDPEIVTGPDANAGGAGGQSAGTGGGGGTPAHAADSGVAATEPDAGSSDASNDAGSDASNDAGSDASNEAGGTVVVGKAGFLLAADPKTDSIYAYSLPDLAFTGRIDGVRFGNHLGAIALADGRVVTSDDKAGQVIAIKMDAAGRPSIVNKADATLGDQAVWGCGDAALTHLAVASARVGNVQTTNIVDLNDFSVTKHETTLKAEEELHSFLAGEPGHVFVSIGGEIQAFPLTAVKSMTAAMAASIIPIGLGSHGPVVTHAYKRVYVTTKGGLDGVDFGATPFARATVIPWDVDGRTTGQNFRPRLSHDGRYVYGAIASTGPEGAAKWAERDADFHVADLMSQTAKRLPLAKGIVPRFQLSKRYAFFANVTGQGDFGILVGVDAGQPSEFHKIVARVPLAALTTGPVPGEATTGKEGRASAITPDGRWSFVSHGGEGKISVIDTNSKAVAGTITTPSPLSGGGYLIALQPGTAPVDPCTR